MDGFFLLLDLWIVYTFIPFWNLKNQLQCMLTPTVSQECILITHSQLWTTFLVELLSFSDVMTALIFDVMFEDYWLKLVQYHLTNMIGTDYVRLISNLLNFRPTSLPFKTALGLHGEMRTSLRAGDIPLPTYYDGSKIDVFISLTDVQEDFPYRELRVALSGVIGKSRII